MGRYGPRLESSKYQYSGTNIAGGSAPKACLVLRDVVFWNLSTDSCVGRPDAMSEECWDGMEN